MIAPNCQFTSLRNRRWLAPVLAAAIIVAAIAPVPAAAQSRDVQPLVNTIDRLERQLRALERTVYRGAEPPAISPGATTGGSPPPAALSQLQLKTSQFEEQMRQLTGQVEEIGFRVNQITDRLDRLVADVDFRLRALEGTGGEAGPTASATAPAVRTPSGPPVPPRTAPSVGEVIINSDAPGPSRVFGTLTESQIRAAGIKPPGSDEVSGGAQGATQQASVSANDDSGILPPGAPEERYEYARGFLMRRDFDGAEQALRAFVEAYPENELAGNAQYWLGETFYVRDDFGTAARMFADGFQRYPDSSKAPDNLLKLGMSLAALDRNEDACITLAKLESEYPKAPVNLIQRAERERTRLKCE